VLGQAGVVVYAAQAAGIGRSAVYKRRLDDPAFAAAWDEALEDGHERLVAEARRRAMAGSERLLIFLIRQHAERVAAGTVSKADYWRAVRRIAEAEGLDPAEIDEMATRIVDEAERG